MIAKVNVADLAEKLARALAEAENEDPHIFDRSEVETLQSVIAFVEKLRALRWFGRGAFYVVVTAGTIIINWERLKEWWG